MNGLSFQVLSMITVLVMRPTLVTIRSVLTEWFVVPEDD